MAKRRKIRPVTDTASAAQKHYGVSDEELNTILNALKATNPQQYGLVRGIIKKAQKLVEKLLG